MTSTTRMMKSYPEFYAKRYKYEKYAQECQDNQQENQAPLNLRINSSTTQESTCGGTIANNLVINTQNSSISPSSSLNESSEHSPSPSSPSSLQHPSNSTPASSIMPLGSITNKLNTKSIDFVAAYSGIASTAAVNCIQSNYYNQAQTYENFANIHNHFQSHLGQFGGYAAAAHHHQAAPFLQQQQQYYASQSANGSHLNTQFKHSANGNGNHRNSTGSSANSSTTSLNSPPSTSDENSPLHNHIFNNQMQLLQQNQHLQSQTNSNSNNNNNNRFGNSYTSNHQALNANTNDVTSNLSTPTINNSLLRISNSSSSLANLSVTSEDSDGSGVSLKKRRPIPVENKDSTYWEKRRKNNESAKRSRDIRRTKEEHISIRVIYLEQENLQLRTEVALLRNEAEKLRAMLYANNGTSSACNPNLMNSNNNGR